MHTKEDENLVGKSWYKKKCTVLLWKLWTLLCNLLGSDHVLDMDSMLTPRKHMNRNLEHKTTM